jgi:hypothetical protein
MMVLCLRARVCDWGLEEFEPLPSPTVVGLMLALHHDSDPVIMVNPARILKELFTLDTAQ